MRQVGVNINDKIRGSLMAGAAGDALGYAVEFKKFKDITSHYGGRGITRFELNERGKAEISDDTQMTLFTANGLLMGLTRGAMRGIGGVPEDYVQFAYMDWYRTQCGVKEHAVDHTWLVKLPEMACHRAPGGTCLNACEALISGKAVKNDSKGCGGIMRVAPHALLSASYNLQGRLIYSPQMIAKAGGIIAEVTHKHPLGFLPAALLNVFVYKIAQLTVEQVQRDIEALVMESLAIMDFAYRGKYRNARQYIRELTYKALGLARANLSDAEAIAQLGGGWVAEETWVIALYATVRHIDSVEEAIIAAVNHDGDSDSTGAVAGNIMGAIYGFDHINRRNIFCPRGRRLEHTLELSEIILALADDLTSGCIISEWEPRDTPEKQRWFARYCEMYPAGIGGRPINPYDDAVLR